MTIRLGHIYRDKVTGFQGTAVALSEYLFACRRVTLNTDVLPDGDIKEGTFDEPSLEYVGPGRLVEVPKLTRTGGTRPTPPRPSQPRR